MKPAEATRLAHGLPDRLEAQTASLERAYEKVLADAARTASRRFGQAALVAAGNWHQPNADDLYNTRLTAEKLAAATGAARRRLVAKVFKAYGFDVKNPAVEGVFAQLGMHITRVVASHREAIMAAIDRAWQEGLSVPHTADLIRTEGVAMAKTRATTIARTEMIGAVNGGSLAVVRTGSSARYKQWLATADDRTREDHVDMDGTVVGVDEPFDVAGSSMMFPGDPNGDAAEVVNCRCTMIYTDAAEGLSADAGIVEGDEMDTLTAEAAAPVAPTEDPAPSEAAARQGFAGTMYVEGVPFVDGRMIEVGATTWRDLPLTIYYLNDIPDYGHTGAVAVGSILTITRNGNSIDFTGEFDTSEIAQEAARLVGEQVIRGVSVDMAPQTVEMRVAGDLLEEADPEPVAASDNGDLVTVDEMNVNDVMQVVTAGLILSATIVGQPASTEGVITLTASATSTHAEVWQILSADGLVACADMYDREEAVADDVRTALGDALRGLLADSLAAQVAQPPASEHAAISAILRAAADALAPTPGPTVEQAQLAASAAMIERMTGVLEGMSQRNGLDVAALANALKAHAERPPQPVELTVHTPDVKVDAPVTVNPAAPGNVHLTVQGQKAMRLVHDDNGRVIGSEPVPEGETD